MAERLCSIILDDVAGWSNVYDDGTVQLLRDRNELSTFGLSIFSIDHYEVGVREMVQADMALEEVCATIRDINRASKG